jgi:hypothetical protein
LEIAVHNGIKCGRPVLVYNACKFMTVVSPKNSSFRFHFMDGLTFSDSTLRDTGTCACGLPSCAVCFLLRSPRSDNQHSILSIPATPDPWDGATFHPSESHVTVEHKKANGPVMISLEEATRAVGVREVSLATALDLDGHSGIRRLPFPAPLQTETASRSKAIERSYAHGYVSRSPEGGQSYSRNSYQSYQSNNRSISPK